MVIIMRPLAINWHTFTRLIALPRTLSGGIGTIWPIIKLEPRFCGHIHILTFGYGCL